MKAKVQILRCEGVQCIDKNLGCYIIVNKELSDVITPIPSSDFNLSSTQISEMSKIEIPCKGELKLILKATHGDPLYMGSVSVNIQNLPPKGFIWLPIFQNIENDSVHNLAGKISTPKILISIEKPAGNYENNTLHKIQIRKLEFVIAQLEERVADMTKFYEDEKLLRNKIAASFELLKNQHDDYVAKSSLRELSMIKLLELKDKEIQEFLSQKNEKIVFEDYFDTECFGHTNEIFLKAQILELTETNSALQSKITNLTEDRERLSSRLFEFEEVLCQQTSTIIEKEEPSLTETLNSLGYSDLFSKNSNNYYFNGNKINLSLENGKIVVNSLPVENFLQLSFTCSPEKTILTENEIHSKTFTHSPKSKTDQTFDSELENINKSFIPDKSSPGLNKSRLLF